MVQFLRFALIYNAATMAASTLMRGGDTAHVFGSVNLFLGIMLGRPDIVVGLALAISLALVLRRDRAVLWNILAALFGLMLLQSGFTMFKGSMALAGTFWADPLLATLDRSLHFGHDPWILTHRMAELIDPGIASQIYVQLWLAVAFGFPVILAAFERDTQRRNRFLILYCMAWIVIGNLLAYAFLSAGPVYYAEFHGGTRFAGLQDALAVNGIDDSLTGFLHRLLLVQLYDGNMIMGSGISAFPSVHVAICTVVSLYVIETARTWAATVLACLFLAAILFLSVYLGWHYAVDGYVSIAIVGYAWYALKHGIFANRIRALQSAMGARAPEPAFRQP